MAFARSADLRGSASERYRRTLLRGALVFRWVALAWMTTLTVTNLDDLERQGWALGSLGLAAIWTAVLSLQRVAPTPVLLWLDLAVCGWVLLASGLVVEEAAVTSNRPFFATAYPVSAVLTWAISGGARNGLVAACILGGGLVLTRPLNGVSLAVLSAEELQNLGGAIVLYLVTGAAVGLVAQLLTESGRALERATAELLEQRERAARLAERESLARRIHDSVLQALALVHKRGRELSRSESVPAQDVARLAEIAGAQEAALRSLILREPEPSPSGSASLRSELEALARRFPSLPVVVAAVGPLTVPSAVASELVDATRQALDNVLEHARATRVTVFADSSDAGLTVTIRDDGCGFDYDERALQRSGKVGLLKSMKGRVEDLGGAMQVTSRPGEGTEIEFTVPLRQAENAG